MQTFRLIVQKQPEAGLFLVKTIEHKSHVESQKKIFFQALKYNITLLERGIYPITTILLFHGKKPLNISSDLQSAFGWSRALKAVFGGDSFNFELNVVDLNKIPDEMIKDKAGDIASFCFALKHVWNMTQTKIKSIFEVCWQNGKEPNYHENASILRRYMLQATSYSREEFLEMEKEVIRNKEDQTMRSTYDELIDEGFQKGIEKGKEKGRESVILNMLKKKMDISTIVECTGVSKEQVVQLQKSLS